VCQRGGRIREGFPEHNPIIWVSCRIGLFKSGIAKGGRGLCHGLHRIQQHRKRNTKAHRKPEGLKAG
jgi:hypothetical protein